MQLPAPLPTRWPVLAVLGAAGGIGASTLAAVLALLAEPGVLIDLDAPGGGIDVLLGIEASSGARWSGLRVSGGHLDPELLARGLPRWRDVPVLAADRAPPAAAVGQVVGAARRLGTVALDVGRAPLPGQQAGLAVADVIVLVTRAEPLALSATAQALSCAPHDRAVLVCGPGPIAQRDVAAALAVPVVARLPRRPTDPARPSAAWRRLGRGLLDGLRTNASSAPVATLAALAPVARETMGAGR